MRKIYGAQRVGENEVQVLLFRDLTQAQIRQYIKQKKPVEKEYLRGATLNGYQGEISESYQIDFSQYQDFDYDMIIKNQLSYFKELNPDQLLEPVEIIEGMIYRDIGNWLNYKEQGLCTLPQVDWRLDTDGYELSEGVILTHRYHTEISVMYEGKRRFRKEEEIQDLCINLTNLHCTFRQKKYEKGKMSDIRYSFDKELKMWLIEDSVVDDTIVAVKHPKQKHNNG